VIEGEKKRREEKRRDIKSHPFLSSLFSLHTQHTSALPDTSLITSTHACHAHSANALLPISVLVTSSFSFFPFLSLFCQLARYDPIFYILQPTPTVIEEREERKREEGGRGKERRLRKFTGLTSLSSFFPPFSFPSSS
jgi:hypothetical protein